MSDDEHKRPAGKRPFRKDGDGDRRPRFSGGERDGDGAAKRGQRPGGKRPLRRPAEQEAEGERIAKRLARAGIASRRDAEELIAAGRVKVNGRVLASPAVNVMAGDRIEVDDTEIPPVERTRLFLFHKPAGVVTTNRDPEGRKTVFDVLPGDLPRLITIGRLDINTEGLLLLTNDGGLARLLELPATGWLRRYRARVHGKVDEKALPALKDGLAVDGVFYGSIEASLDREQGANAWMTIGLREGKNREVKNILGALGLDVTRLIRISYGPFQLGELKEGEVQEIKGRMLRDQLGERLIEEAGANFDAPILHHREGPRRDEAETRPARDAAPRVKRDGERGAIGEGGLIKRRRKREDARGDALARLDTKPGFQKRPPRGEGRDAKPAETHAARKANVWMAPGARPQGKPKPEAEEARPRPARKAGAERQQRFGGAGRSDRPVREDRPRPEGGRPFRPRPRAEGEPQQDAGRADRPARSDKPRRFDGSPRAGRAERADTPRRFERPDRDNRPAGDKKPFRDRSADSAGERPFKPRPRAEGAGAESAGRSERPRCFERPERSDRPAGDKPRFRPRPEGGERAASGESRPRRFDKGEAGQKPFKPRGPRPEGGRPGGAGKPGGRPKPQGHDRPRGGDRPGGGDRPRPSGPKRPRPDR